MVTVQTAGFKVRFFRLLLMNFGCNAQGCRHRNCTCDLQDKRLGKEWFLPLGSRLSDWFTAGQRLFALLELAQGKYRHLLAAVSGGFCLSCWICTAQARVSQAAILNYPLAITRNPIMSMSRACAYKQASCSPAGSRATASLHSRAHAGHSSNSRWHVRCWWRSIWHNLHLGHRQWATAA